MLLLHHRSSNITNEPQAQGIQRCCVYLATALVGTISTEAQQLPASSLQLSFPSYVCHQDRGLKRLAINGATSPISYIHIIETLSSRPPSDPPRVILFHGKFCTFIMINFADTLQHLLRTPRHFHTAVGIWTVHIQHFQNTTF